MLRVREADLRPRKFDELKTILNSTEFFLQKSRLAFANKDEDEKPFTDGDLDSLEKVINDVQVR